MRKRLAETILRLLRIPRSAPEVPGDPSPLILRSSHRVAVKQFIPLLLMQLLLATTLLLSWFYFGEVRYELIDFGGLETLKDTLVDWFVPNWLRSWRLSFLYNATAYSGQLALSLFVPWLRLGLESRWYVVGRRSVPIREGWWTLSEKSADFDRIQNVRLSAGPLQKIFRLSDIEIYTAGGGDKNWSSRDEKAQKIILFRDLEDPEPVLDLLRRRIREHSTDLRRPEKPSASPEAARAAEQVLKEAQGLRQDVSRRTARRESNG